ncbi:penicillin-binding protein activator [Orbaceae bacterium ESL0721]|nr:penicillin-binding protein activator [Orbaceae bacterium ESL0721]
MNVKHVFYTLIISILLTGCFASLGKKESDIDIKQSDPYQYYSKKIVNEDTNSRAHDYIELAKYGSAEQIDKTIHDTWKFLSSLSDDEIKSILIYSNETTLQGWIDLIYAYRTNKQSYTPDLSDTAEELDQKNQALQKQLADALNDWSLQYTDHPAKILLSDLINNYHPSTWDQSDNSGKKVALLLPLNGNLQIFGETIRQGYLDANKFYPDEPAQSVTVFDTTSAPLNQLVAQAKEQGAEMIVGPLLKEQVVEIKNLSPDLPVLALNKVDNDENIEENTSTNENSKICFFALSPEDEAKDAATHIFAEKRTKPLLLVPDTDLGRRVAQSFAKQWQQLSHTQAYMQPLADAKTLSTKMNNGVGIKLIGEAITIEDSANINSSIDSLYSTDSNDSMDNSSSTDIRQTVNESDEAFDAIYVYASYDQLTFIKAMIEMESDWSLSSPSAPRMYTSSKSNSAKASTDFYYDMERVQFAEIPMIVNQAEMVSDQLSETIPTNIKNDYSLMRLYAMGIDAWFLANHFTQLTDTTTLDGMTGKLTTQSECEITRALIWQKFHQGKAELVTDKLVTDKLVTDNIATPTSP